MSSRSIISARIQIAFFAVLVLLTMAASLSVDLSKFQERGPARDSLAVLQGISSPGELEGALKQHPSDNVLQLMAKATKVVDNTKAAINQLSARIEPAGLSKDLNFGSASLDEIGSFRRDLKTAEANAAAFLPRYAAILTSEQEQIKIAAVSSHVPKELSDQLLDGVRQRHAKMLNAISKVLTARTDYYRAYDNYVAFLSSELGSFKVVAGQLIFANQGAVERYNAAAQAMTSAGRRVNELETDLKKHDQSLPEEWLRLTAAK